MKYADTEFVCFLDVDDLWNERFLQVAVGKLKNSEYAFVILTIMFSTLS